MHESELLINVLYYLVAALVAVPIFRRLGLGSILGYLAAGLVIGPYGLGLIQAGPEILHFAEMGVVMLLFVIGLELAPSKFWQMRSEIAVSGGLQLAVCAALIAGLALLLGVSGKAALVLGLTLALSSTAFAIQLMAERGMLANRLGRQGLGILLFQDLAVIPILLLVDGLASASDPAAHTQPWWWGALAIMLVLLIGRLLINPALKYLAGAASREVMTCAALFIVLGVAMLMQAVGLSMGLGAFVAGIVLANSDYRHQLEADIEPFKGLLLGLFFIAVGMGMNLGLLLQEPLLIIATALGLIAIKTVVIAVLAKTRQHNWRDAMTLGISLGQGGEFAFVILSQAVANGVVASALAEQVTLAVGLSMALTSPLLMLLASLPDRQAEKPDYDQSAPQENPEVIIVGFGRFGQIVARILRASQIKFTGLEYDPGQVDFFRAFGNPVFYGDATRLDILEQAGIAEARVLVVSPHKDEDIATIVKQIRPRYPELKLIVRAKNRAHAMQLHELGADKVIRETFDSSVRAATDTLELLGFPPGKALEFADKFRTHDELLLQDAVAHRGNSEHLEKMHRQGISDLEQLFLQDEQNKK